MNEEFYILMRISVKIVPKGPIDTNPALVQVMAWKFHQMFKDNFRYSNFFIKNIPIFKKKNYVEIDKLHFGSVFVFLSSTALKKFSNGKFYVEFIKAELEKQFGATGSEIYVFQHNVRKK